VDANVKMPSLFALTYKVTGTDKNHIYNVGPVYIWKTRVMKTNMMHYLFSSLVVCLVPHCECVEQDQPQGMENRETMKYSKSY